MKLFRAIREKLINEGNLKRYLFYAVGEILLVMIGISLAFRVDNWNDNRINKASEISYYENIKNEIDDDKRRIQGQMDFNNLLKTQFQYANNIIESNDRSNSDTLGLIVRNLIRYSDFDKEGNIYETMVNSGEIKLLKNRDIVRGVRTLEEIYNYLNRMETIHYDAMMSYVVPTTSTIIKMYDGTVMKPELLYNYEFQNLVLALLTIMDEKDQVYKSALNEIDLILTSIDDELANK